MSEGLTLYQIAGNLSELLYREPDGDLPVEERDELVTCLLAQLRAKSAGVVAVDRNMSARIAAIDGEIDRLKNLKSTVAKAQARYRQYVKSCLQSIGETRIETDIGTVSVKRNPASVCVTDVAAVPAAFNRTKITVEPDKTAIMDHFKATGEVLPGVAIVQDSTRLEIK